MSIARSLQKISDPIAAAAEEAERKRQREQQKKAEAGEGPRFRCRICGVTGDDGGWCLACLAETMVAISRGPGAP